MSDHNERDMGDITVGFSGYLVASFPRRRESRGPGGVVQVGHQVQRRLDSRLRGNDMLLS